MKGCKITITVRETAKYSEIESLIHWLETPVPGSRADNVIEKVEMLVNNTAVSHK